MGACKSSPNVENPHQEVDFINEQILKKSKEPEKFTLPEIFNREKEKSLIINILDETPQINVFVGGPNCGKTTLLDYILGLLNFKKEIHLISWNLRFQNFF